MFLVRTASIFEQGKDVTPGIVIDAVGEQSMTVAGLLSIKVIVVGPTFRSMISTDCEAERVTVPEVNA